MRRSRLGGLTLVVGLVVLAALVTGSRSERREAPKMATSIWDQAKKITPGGSGSPVASPVGQPLSFAGQAIQNVGNSVVDPNAGSYYDQPVDAGTGYVPPARELASSPEWLAYLNALGVQEQALRADTDKMRALYQSDAQRQLQDLPAGYIQQRRSITGSMEGRGMARSGEFLRRLAENRAQQGRAEAGVNAQLGFQVGSLESQLAQKLIDMNMQRAQQEATMRAQGYV